MKMLSCQKCLLIIQLAIMDIEALCDVIEHSLDPLISYISLCNDYDIKLILETDDWDKPNIRRKFELECIQVKECNISPGTFDCISFHSEHPLLSLHQGNQGYLHFSSPPLSPSEVFFEAHKALIEWSAGWIDPANLLNGTPEQFKSYLLSGNGMLAHGPLSAMTTLADNLNTHLKVNVVSSVNPAKRWKVLIIGSQAIICESVHVEACDG